MSLVEEYKALRKKHSKTIKEISEISGISKTAISYWEYMGISPTAENLNKALQALGYELKICKKEEIPPC